MLSEACRSLSCYNIGVEIFSEISITSLFGQILVLEIRAREEPPAFTGEFALGATLWKFLVEELHLLLRTRVHDSAPAPFLGLILSLLVII